MEAISKSRCNSERGAAQLCIALHNNLFFIDNESSALLNDVESITFLLLPNTFLNLINEKYIVSRSFKYLNI